MAKKKQDMAAMLDGFEAAAAKEHEAKEAKAVAVGVVASRTIPAPPPSSP